MKTFLINFEKKYFFPILLAFSFALPFNTLTSVNSLLMGLLFLLWIAKITISNEPVLFRTPLDIPLLGFFVWVGLSLLWTADFHESFNGFIALGKQIFLFYLFATTVKTRDQFVKILCAFLAAMLITDLYAINDFFTLGGNLLDRQIRAGAFGSRDSHRLASLIVIFIPLTFIYGIYYRGSKIIKSGLFIFTALSTLVLFIGYTRGAWVAATFELLVFGLFYSRRFFYFILILIPIVSIVAFLAIKKHNTHLINSQTKIYSDTLDTQNLGVRIDVWEFGIGEILKNPILGYGFGREIFEKVNKDKKIVKPTPHLHNTIVETAFEVGLPGLILLLISFWKVFDHSLFLFKLSNDSFISLYSYFMVVMVCGLVIRNLFDHMFIGNIAEIFWVLSGLLFSFPSNSLSLAQKFPRLDRTPNVKQHIILPDSPFHP